VVESRKTDALLIAAIIICGAVIIVPYILPKPVPEITLRILTRIDPSITGEIESAFLDSTYAKDNRIIDLEWLSRGSSSWDLYAGSGEADLALSDLATIVALSDSNLLRPMDSSPASLVTQTIAGVSMKHYELGLPIWCSFAIRPTIIDLLVNESLLQSYGLMTPDTIDALLSPSYWPSGRNTSLIGMETPETTQISYGFLHLLTEKIGWETGIRVCTLLYANSLLSDESKDTLTMLLQGEVAITPITSTTRKLTPLPPTITFVHLDDLVAVQPNVVAITNGTLQLSSAQAFIDYLLSPEGQSIWLNIDVGYLPVRREAFQVAENEIDYNTYDEFNWTLRTRGPGVFELSSIEDFALGLYLNASACSSWSSLTKVWRNLGDALENGSIIQPVFTHFRNLLTEPLEITDPISHANESLTESYARRILTHSINSEYLTEISCLWRIAANQRYEAVLSFLSSVI
jgi:ABC-type Fe3+ transport system substrate-binding protein